MLPVQPTGPTQTHQSLGDMGRCWGLQQAALGSQTLPPISPAGCPSSCNLWLDMSTGEDPLPSICCSEKLETTFS